MAERRKKTVGTPFPKGKSGNPGGVSKAKKEFIQQCRDKLPECFEVLGGYMYHEDPDVALRALKMIIEYGAGKPKQVIAGDNEQPLFDTRALADALYSKLGDA